MPSFVPGLELARVFYSEAVAPLLSGVPHSAARMGGGSDALRFDTERSIDHGWGPRLQLLLDPPDVVSVRALLDERLPEAFRGWPVRFGWDDVPVTHHVEVDTPGGWFESRLSFDPGMGVTTIDWLATPQQLLLEATAGEVFHDGLGALEPPPNRDRLVSG